MSLLSKAKTWALRVMMWCVSRQPEVQVCLSSAAVSKIAVMQFGGIGDMLLVTGGIKALTQAFPQAKITIFCSSEEKAQFLKRFEFVEEIIVGSYQKRSMLSTSLPGLC